MKEFFGAAVFAGLIAVGTIGIGWGATELGYQIYRHYAQLNEQVRRETFEQSRAYQEGMIRDLENMQLDYAKASPNGKAAIRSVAQHRLADVDTSILPPNVRGFIQQLRDDQ